jgi:carbon storage regulator CsrA
MLILSRKIDEKIQIGDNITLTIIDIHGEQVKIGVEAPKNIKVFRQEVFEAIQKDFRATQHYARWIRLDTTTHRCTPYPLKGAYLHQKGSGA